MQTQKIEKEKKKIIVSITFEICGIFPTMQSNVHHENDHPIPMLFETKQKM